MSKVTIKSVSIEILQGKEQTILIRAKNNDFALADKIKQLGEGDFKVEIDKWREKRSIDANCYAWVLMDEIARVLLSTKEDVYKQMIKKVGVFEIMPIKNIAVERFISRWEDKGLGWVCESLGSSKINGYTNVIAYYGTSVYDTKEMATFIDEVVSTADELGIETKTPDEIAKLKSMWGEE